jgi:TfoX/Sxy family transcriptional regulator of competence genes
MATQQRTVDFLVEQVARAGAVTQRKMFGEFALYCDGKVVALVCGDELFVKPIDAGRAHLGTVTGKPPYTGAKDWFWIDGDLWDDGDWLVALIRVTAAELPVSMRIETMNYGVREFGILDDSGYQLSFAQRLARD